MGLHAGMVAVGAASAAMAAGLGVSIANAAKFEQTMSGVKAVSGATAAEFKQLSDKALQLGKDTSFSASEAAAGIEELVKGGVSVADVLNGAAEATLNLAAAGGVSLPEAAEIASNAINQFNLDGEKMAHVSDLIAGAANASSLSVGDFRQSLGQAGAAMHASGQSIDSVATSIAVLGAAGIKGSDAGTSLRVMFGRLIPTTADANAAFKALGLQTGALGNAFLNADGSFKQAAEVAEILHDRTQNLTEAEKTLALQMIFGEDAKRSAIVLSEAGAAGFDKMAESMGKVTAAEVAKTRLDNLSGSVEQLKGSFETATIAIGAGFTPVVREAVDKVTQAINEAIPQLNTWQERLGEAFATGGFDAWLREVGDVAGEIGTSVSTWGERFGDFLQPAQVRAKVVLDELWLDTIQPWIEETSTNVGHELELHWGPAFGTWVETSAVPEVKKGLGAFASAIGEWVRGEGRTAVYNAGLELGRIYRDGVLKGLLVDLPRDIASGIGGAVQDAWNQAHGIASPDQKAAGYASYNQPPQPLVGPTAGLAFPVQGYSGSVAPHWGSNRGAADLFAPTGTPVVAAGGGVVVGSGYDPTGGNYVMVRGPNGLEYYYAHLNERPAVAMGQQVTPGQYLGGVGQTGNAAGTGAHLHFGVGYGIQSGTGPAGGSGINFDATAALQEALARQRALGGGAPSAPVAAAPRAPASTPRAPGATAPGAVWDALNATPEQKARAKKDAKDTGAEVAANFGDGFMGELTKSTATFEAYFGKEGGKVASALAATLAENIPNSSSEAAVARSMEELITAAREAGLPTWRESGDELAGAILAAITERTPEARQAAMDLIMEMSRAISQSHALTPESFTNALGLADLAAQIGPQGSAIMSALETALTKGGAQNIQALGKAMTGLRQTLLSDKELDPAEAQAKFATVMEAVQAAIADGSPAALEELRGFLADFNRELETSKIAENAARLSNVAIENAQVQITALYQAAEDRKKQLYTNLAIEQWDRGQQEMLDTWTRNYLEDTNQRVDALKRERQEFRETQALERQELKETADLEKGYQEARQKLLDKLKETATSSAGNMGKAAMAAAAAQGFRTGPVTEPGADLAKQLRELDAQHVKDQAELVANQAARRQERIDRKADRDADLAYFKTLDDTILKPAAASAKQINQDWRDNYKLLVLIPRDINAITTKTDEDVTKINAGLTTALEKYNTDADTALTRLQLMHTETWPLLKEDADHALDVYAATAQAALAAIEKGHQILSGEEPSGAPTSPYTTGQVGSYPPKPELPGASAESGMGGFALPAPNYGAYEAPIPPPAVPVIDYRELAAAIAQQPIVVQIDREPVARAARTGQRYYNQSNLTNGVGGL
jgi:TP901 family phage tail tape measure protein